MTSTARSGKQTKNKTDKMKIKIKNAPESLTKYTHASLSDQSAKRLSEQVKGLSKLGIFVISANGSRNTVPTSYRSAYKMNAPYWFYVNGEIKAIDAKLKNRIRGASIPANFTVAGSVPTPEGFKCTSRNEEFTVLREM